MAHAPAVVVDGDPARERRAQPGKLAGVQDQVIGIRLRVVVTIAAQRLADDREAVARHQRVARGAGAVRQIIGREHLVEVVIEGLAQQLLRHRGGRIAGLRRVSGVGDDAGAGVQVALVEEIHQRQAERERDRRGKIGVRAQHRRGGRHEVGVLEAHLVRGAVVVGEARKQAPVQAIDTLRAVADAHREQPVEAPHGIEQAHRRIDHDRAVDLEALLLGVDRLDDRGMRAAE
jgi:hypothetical protein